MCMERRQFPSSQVRIEFFLFARLLPWIQLCRYLGIVIFQSVLQATDELDAIWLPMEGYDKPIFDDLNVQNVNKP